MLPPISCPVCNSNCSPLDVVDFNKACEEMRGKFLKLSGIPIYYYLCNNCQFCFAPEFMKWELRDFEEKIYNQDYVLVDPDYLDSRPRQLANKLLSMFPVQGPQIKHLDFGGGDGLLSRILREANWQSTSYDPFVDKDTKLGDLGQFQLITAFEVFEHVPDVCRLIRDLSSLLASDGIVLFTTNVSDGQIAQNRRINWWYASPRNGHISLFSRKSLAILGGKEGFTVGGFSDGLHMLSRRAPAWASHLFPQAGTRPAP
ncbi:MAG: class I SAM-dependent methyltransferase [Nitrosomonadales bacterium]|nr:class I SAM-dependent methyltransferase [Nitrosomonadales bacterium]